MTYLFLLLLFGLIFWLEVPEMVRKKQKRLLFTFLILMAMGMALSMALALGVEIPSPTTFITKLLAPLATKVFGVKITPRL